MGYHRAGFDVVGVDHLPQKRYPFEFHQADALEFLAAHGQEFDAIHASPPCQQYSRTRHIHGRNYPDLLGPTRAALEKNGRPFVIENVGDDAPWRNAFMLCGTFFGLRVIRHRYFESSAFIFAPARSCYHPPDRRCAAVGRPIQPGQFVTVAGNISGVKLAGEAMGIDWMVRRELVQAIPPAYSEFIGRQLLHVLEPHP